MYAEGKDKAEEQKISILIIFGLVFIQYRQEGHCSALIQICQVATYNVKSVQSISVYCC